MGSGRSNVSRLSACWKSCAPKRSQSPANAEASRNRGVSKAWNCHDYQLPPMNPVAIIGAGITGLTAAFYLKRKGIPVTVYESSGRVGGVIQSIRKDGYLAEFGPNTILETSPKIGQLVRDAGLTHRRLDPDPKAEARYVVRYKRPIAMPGSPLGFLTTKLFTPKAKLALLREPFVPPRRDGK